MDTRIKELIRKYDIKPKKSWGQNFLIDDRIIRHIVEAAEISRNDLVIEIGAGVGNMTRELAQRANRVIAVEVDDRLLPALAESLAGLPNVEIINKDIMDTDLNALIHKETLQKITLSVKAVANLPYYITTPVIMKFLEEMSDLDMLVFTVQKEVADRISAGPGCRDYGILSVAAQFYSRPEVVLNIPPHCFIPQPEVDSSVVKMNIRKVPLVKLLDKEIFFKTIRACFGHRRKKLVNALFNSGYFTKDREEIKEILKNLGIDENQRGETLSIMQFAHLANAFSRKNC